MFSGWKETIARSYLRGDRSKNIILFFSTLISFSSLMLAAGFYYGANQFVETAQEQIVDSSLYKATKKEFLSSGDSTPLSVVKITRPKRDELGLLNDIMSSCVVTDDLSKLFPGNHELLYDEKRLDDVLFSPVYSSAHLQSKKSLLIAGEIPLNEEIGRVAINKTFASTLSSDFSYLIGQKLSISIRTKIIVYDSLNVAVEDVFMTSLQLEICGIFEELAFLNTPKIFYSHIALEDYLVGYELEDLSDHFGRNISCLNVFEMIDDNHYLTNYNLNVFVLSEQEITKMSTLSKTLKKSASSLAFESSSLMIIETYEEVTKAALYSMIIFIVIAFVGTCSIMALGAYSSYVSKKKESAILSCLGAHQKSIFDIFFYKNSIIASLAILASFISAAATQLVANKLLYKHFMFKNLIRIPFTSFLNQPFFLIIIVLFLGYSTTLIFTYLPLRFYKGLPLAEELREN